MPTSEFAPANDGFEDFEEASQMKKKLAAFGAVLGLLLYAVPMFAHHAFAAEYDKDKPVKVKGVVTKVEWTNPHIWFFVDVKDESGKVTNWGFSGGPPGMLQRRGITKNVLKLGDVVVVEGFQAKDASNNASGGNVTFENGKKVFAGSAEDAQNKE
jgi:hypothetical protein